MPRYVINVTSNGERLFSTSRSSIGNDTEKLARLVNLFDILGRYEDDMSMEVMRIGDAKAEPCNLKGVPLDQVPQPMGGNFDEPFGDSDGPWAVGGNGNWFRDMHDQSAAGRSRYCVAYTDSPTSFIVTRDGNVIASTTTLEAGKAAAEEHAAAVQSISLAELKDHPAGKANAASWATLGNKPA